MAKIKKDMMNVLSVILKDLIRIKISKQYYMMKKKEIREEDKIKIRKVVYSTLC